MVYFQFVKFFVQIGLGQQSLILFGISGSQVVRGPAQLLQQFHTFFGTAGKLFEFPRSSGDIFTLGFSSRYDHRLTHTPQINIVLFQFGQFIEIVLTQLACLLSGQRHLNLDTVAAVWSPYKIAFITGIDPLMQNADHIGGYVAFFPVLHTSCVDLVQQTRAAGEVDSQLAFLLRRINTESAHNHQ